MNQSFWKRFWLSAQKSYGALVAILSMALALLQWFFPPATRVPLGIVLFASTLGAAVLFTLAHMAESVSPLVESRAAVR